VLAASRSTSSVSSVSSDEKESPGLCMPVISPVPNKLFRSSPKLPIGVKWEGECGPEGPQLSIRLPYPTPKVNEATCAGSCEGEWALLRCVELKSSILLLLRAGDCGPGLGEPAVILSGTYIMGGIGDVWFGL
jgi:hypothetical protein